MKFSETEEGKKVVDMVLEEDCGWIELVILASNLSYEAGQKANAEDCKEWQLKQENIIRASERTKTLDEVKKIIQKTDNAGIWRLNQQEVLDNLLDEISNLRGGKT